MQIDFNNYEYNSIVSDILSNREFKKIENCSHHKTNRLEHSRRVSFLAYKVCKRWNLDYVSAARGGLLHDFFTNNYKNEKGTVLLKTHPKLALYNSKKHFTLNNKEENIIESHMFPVSLKCKPKYIESLIVSTIDKVACVYEKTIGYSTNIGFKAGKMAIYLFLVLPN